MRRNPNQTQPKAIHGAREELAICLSVNKQYVSFVCNKPIFFSAQREELRSPQSALRRGKPSRSQKRIVKNFKKILL